LLSRTVGFPESGWRAWLFPQGLPGQPGDLSTDMHTPLQPTVYPALGTPPQLRRNWAQCPATARPTCPPSPRAPLPSPGVTLQRVMSTITSVTVTPPSSLLRAHAPDRSPSRRLALMLAIRVFAGCCRPRLGIDPSRPYLCKSFPGCLAPYPGCLPKCSCSFLPLDHRPSLYLE